MRIKHGFSLVELLVVLVVACLAITLFYPSYQTFILKGRRNDAITTLLNLQAAEEKYRLDNASYGDLTAVWGGITVTPQGYYNLSISSLSGTAYTLTATAKNSQTKDTACSTITLTKSSDTETQTPAICWQ